MLHTNRQMQKHIQHNKDERTQFFRKMYLSLYSKGLCVRGSWRLNKDFNILTSPAPPDIAVCLSRSPWLLNRRPGAQLSAESWFSLLDPEHCFKTLISNYNCSFGGMRAPSSGCWFSLPHFISNWLTFCLHPGYIIVRHPPSSCERHKSHSIQPVHGQGYILIFFDLMHLLFTEVHFLFWQLGRVGGQYATCVNKIWTYNKLN